MPVGGRQVGQAHSSWPIAAAENFFGAGDPRARSPGLPRSRPDSLIGYEDLPEIAEAQTLLAGSP